MTPRKPLPRGYMGKRSHHACSRQAPGEVVTVERVVVAGPPPYQKGDRYLEKVWRPMVSACRQSTGGKNDE